MYIKADIMIGTNKSFTTVMNDVIEVVTYNGGIEEDILDAETTTGGVRFVVEFENGYQYDMVIMELSELYGGEVSTFMLT
jgi:hypothetical protein